ncbi:MAG: ECF-type sigma factor [Planctomycetota bacterium]
MSEISHSRSFTQLLDSASSGNCADAEELFPIVYDELRRIAERFMRSERADHTLQTTALIHEAYVQLTRRSPTGDQQGAEEGAGRKYNSSDHFVATAALVMRRVLINHAKARSASKRRPQGERLVDIEIVDQFSKRSVDLVVLDEALERLQQLDPMQAQIVQLRFFGGMTVERCAEYLGVSARKVQYEWAHARAWLHQQLVQE